MTGDEAFEGRSLGCVMLVFAWLVGVFVGAALVWAVMV